MSVAVQQLPCWRVDLATVLLSSRYVPRTNKQRLPAYEQTTSRRSAPQPTAPQRNATQRNATQRNATQRNATQRNATERTPRAAPRARSSHFATPAPCKHHTTPSHTKPCRATTHYAKPNHAPNTTTPPHHHTPSHRSPHHHTLRTRRRAWSSCQFRGSAR